MKTCGKCKKAQALSAFNKSKKGLHGRQRYCRVCQNAYYKASKAKRLEQTRNSKRRNTGAKYGLTEEQNKEFRARNGGMCECCNERKATCIDHDHLTGELRGHLCGLCNTGIGMLGDTYEGVKRALDYLAR